MDTIPVFRNAVSFVLLAILLLFSLGACSTGLSSTTTPLQTTTPSVKQSTPTATSLPAGTVLYQANWSNGLAGLSGAQGWKVVQGQLQSGASGSASFTIPYMLRMNNYAIEIRLQVVRSSRQIRSLTDQSGSTER